MALCPKSSPLEIPEIALLIAAHLDDKSLVIACRVSRLWRRLCQPLIFRSLACTDLHRKSCYEGVLRHPHMIRSFEWYSQPDTEGVFADLATINKQLERDFSVKQRLATIGHLKKNKKTAKGVLKHADDDVIEDLDCAANADGSNSCYYSSQDDGFDDDDDDDDDDDEYDDDDDDENEFDFDLSEEDDLHHRRIGGSAGSSGGGGGSSSTRRGRTGRSGSGKSSAGARSRRGHQGRTGRGIDPISTALMRRSAGPSSSSSSSSTVATTSSSSTALTTTTTTTTATTTTTTTTTTMTASNHYHHLLHRQRLLMQLEREQAAYLQDEKELTEDEIESLLLKSCGLTSLTLFKSNRLGASLVNTIWTALPSLVTLKLHTKHLMGVESLDLTELMRVCPLLETLWLSGMPCTFDSEDYRDKEREKDHKSHCSNFVMCTTHPGRVILRATSTTCRESDYLMKRYSRQEAEPMKFRLKELMLRNVGICVDELQDLTNHCPGLEQLFLYDTLQWEWPISFFPTLAKSCPKLWSFQFDTPLRPVTEDGIIEVLEALPNLRTFGARLTHFGDRALRLLQSGACPNLTSLDVSFSRFRRLTSEQVRIFLMSYPKLKHFKADGIFLNEEQDDHDLGSGSDEDHQNWVCTELETLLIGFHNPLNLRARNTLMYSQLRRLTKLRYLGITDTFLKISIKVGLSQLAVLKELRHFNIETSNYPKLRRSDIDWIAQNWPKLEILQIGGGGDPNTHRRVRGWLAEAGRSEIKVYSQKHM
ncbi:hypothetical protein DFQ26_001689 [Actinomortierella ambigua]|nr:hypothetical protein DFQ26_001689 [Actinomortierella ambigua]